MRDLPIAAPSVPIPEELAPENELVVCVSGGKDSSAMALWLRFDSGLENKLLLVFCDTGHEHPATVEHVHKLADKVGLALNTIRGPWSFITLAEKKQRFPSATARFCTEELKVIPLSGWLDDQEGAGILDAPVLVQGIRADESKKRSELPAWDTNNKPGRRRVFDCNVWRPLLRWSASDVFETHKRHGFEPNPLYKQGASRVGCFPCIFAGKSDLRASFELDGGLLERLRGYEARVAKAAKRGEGSLFPPKKTPRRFHDKTHVNRKGETWSYPSIDAVYRWAMGDEHQGDLFENEDPPMCWSHYGLCE